jgi:mitochondrial translocator assembly and maintenance protein 41
MTSQWRPASQLLYIRSPGRSYSSETTTHKSPATQVSKEPGKKGSERPDEPPLDWDENPNLSISTFSELPSTNFGVNQHMIINQEFKEALRQILWQFRAPIRYAFAYGSGVFPQSAQATKSASQLHPSPGSAISAVQGGSGKMIDFIFGVSHTQHWHSLNLHQHRDHYSAVGSLGSYAVSRIQDKMGAGVYFNPYITVNGTLIKYGVVNIDTLCTDLADWTTLYLAGRLQKPVKILRDDPRVRLANQVNLLSALRTALLLLPERFTEKELYATIAGISYMGDIRMSLPAENASKVNNIVTHQLSNFRRLYAPLIETLPNVTFVDPRASSPDFSWDSTVNANLQQDMDPLRRGNMVRRLPKAFRQKVYFAFQSRYQIPRAEFNKMLEESADEDAKGIKRRQGGRFEMRVAKESENVLRKEISGVIKKTIWWPSTSQSLKSILTAGVSRSWRYGREKYQKWQDGRKQQAEKPNDKESSKKNVVNEDKNKKDSTTEKVSNATEKGAKEKKV